MKKGQVAMEFAMGISLLFIIFTIFMAILTTRLAEKSEEDYLLIMEDFSELVISEVEVASYVADGYERSFVLPDTVLGLGYSFSKRTDDNFDLVTIDVVGTIKDYTFPLITNVNGYFVPGLNIIKKQGGVISVNP